MIDYTTDLWLNSLALAVAPICSLPCSDCLFKLTFGSVVGQALDCGQSAKQMRMNGVGTLIGLALQ